MPRPRTLHPQRAVLRGENQFQRAPRSAAPFRVPVRGPHCKPRVHHAAGGRPVPLPIDEEEILLGNYYLPDQLELAIGHFVEYYSRIETTARYAHLARESVHKSASRIADSIAADLVSKGGELRTA